MSFKFKVGEKVRVLEVWDHGGCKVEVGQVVTITQAHYGITERGHWSNGKSYYNIREDSYYMLTEDMLTKVDLKSSIGYHLLNGATKDDLLAAVQRG